MTYIKNLRYDLPAGMAVFFVAVPLCLGLAHASGAPLLSGLIAGVIGGILVGILSASPLSVAGPANGLTALTIIGIQEFGTYSALLPAIVMAGLIQIILGLMKAGIVSKYIPNTVINGMLIAIGLILIFKQLPHLLGYDVEVMGVEEFNLTHEDISEGEIEEKNTFTTLLHSLSHINPIISAVGLSSLWILFIWDSTIGKKIRIVPGSLIVVVLGAAFLYFYPYIDPSSNITANHFVSIPELKGFASFWEQTISPNWSVLNNPKIYSFAITIAIIASLETLLSIEAIDKLDPYRRTTPINRELLAQGLGNSISGLVGGLPITSVIARSSVNLSAGATTKISTIVHGILMLIGVLCCATLINTIPLTCLAAVLVFVGYKLAAPNKFIKQYKQGWDQFIPALVTTISVLLSDLLIGVSIGIVVSMFFIVAKSYQAPSFTIEEHGNTKHFILGESVNFLHKYKVISFLESVPENSILEIDSSKNLFIDHDIEEVLKEFEYTAKEKNITLIFGNAKIVNND